MGTYSEHLRSATDEQLVALLSRRPDLASPSPGNVTSLAVRATGRSSLERALATVDAVVLQVLDAVVALGGADAQRVQSAIAGGPDDEVARAVDDALTLALLYPSDDTPADPLHATLAAAPGVAELLGQHPAGLALDAPAPSSWADVDDVTVALPPPDDPLAAPARALLDALTWGPPVGLAPEPGSPPGDAVQWLLRHGLLVRGTGRHVLLPAGVALTLRAGRTHRAVASPPDLAAAPRRAPATVEAEAATAGERHVRLVARLLRRWEEDPPGVLRAGGLGVRDLRRTAADLDVDEREAALVVEVAAAAGLVAPDDEDTPTFAPTAESDAWSALDLPQRWAALAAAWLTTTRTPWLVGTRDERGSLLAALDPELARPWAPRLRRSVLHVLAGTPGAAPDATLVVGTLGWATPRAVPPQAAVEAVLTEAALVGVLGAGALGLAGRALLDSADPDAAVEAFAAGLTPEVEDLLLQGDLTGIVPGRPSQALDALLERTAVVESRGGAVTVRFTPESVRAGLDDGRTADDLLDELATHARGPVPQPLEYLVRDAARRHGRLRAGAASSYLRADDPALLAGLADDPRLATLGLVQLAPTVLAAQAPTRELVETLRAHGLSPVAETSDGLVLHLERPVHRSRRRPRRRAGDVTTHRTDLAALVARLRSGESGVAHDEPARSSSEPAPRARRSSGTADPSEALALLREAVADRTDVWVELVGPTGRSERRRLRPLRVEGGRLRALDQVRESELSVAVHRIASVARADEDEELEVT